MLAKQREEQSKLESQALLAKAGGSVQGLNEQERERYRQLQSRS